MKPEDNHITINADKIIVHLDSSERIVIPRAKLRTRLELLAWTYSLILRPGMTLHRLRAFIAAVFRHHGWTLPAEGGHFARYDSSVEYNGNDEAVSRRLQLAHG
jgi:hypothetical protein